MRAALFDMDRTLVRRDTASLYVRYQRDIGEADWRQAARVAWWMLQYSFGVIDAGRVAEQVAADYAGRDERQMIESCRRWFRDYVLAHVSPTARRVVRQHREAGDRVAIVTGATRYAAAPLAAELGIEELVTTEMEVEDGRLTGRLVEPLCFGSGKVVRAERLARAGGFSLDRAVFYSDSITDLPLFERVGRPVAVNPDGRLRRLARRRGWDVERW
jgi:HAD superfamily hydrolase (TIGR01490 family)